MKKICFIMGIVFLFTAIDFAQVRADGQLWTNVDFVVGLKKEKDEKGKEFDRIALNFSVINRFGDDVSRPVDQRIGTTVDFQINKFLTISPGYLYQKATPNLTTKNYESRVSIAATLNKRYKDFNFRTRQQFDQKFRNNRADNQNYRPLFQVSYFVKKDKKDLFSPFVSNESYYDTLSKSWNRNEFRAGINRRFTNKISADFFYIRLDSTALDANGLGIGLKFRLR